jgi:hypothetical protein
MTFVRDRYIDATHTRRSSQGNDTHGCLDVAPPERIG